MFHNRDWFGLLPSFRFHRFLKPDFLPRQKNPASSNAPSQSNGKTKQSIQQPVQADKIEKSQVAPETSIKPVEKAGCCNKAASLRPYNPAEMLRQALRQNCEDKENACQPVEDKQYIEQRNWQNRIDLNLKFNLSEFESSLTQLVEDSQDGEMQTETLTNINLGLHVDLSVKGKLNDIIKNAGLGQEGTASQQALVAKVRTASNQAAAMQVQSRNFEADMFYRESQATNFKIRQEYSDGFMRVSRKLSMRYSQDFSLNFRSLQAYNSQAAQLSETGDLTSYLNNAEALVDSNQIQGETIGKFFDIVQGYLDQTEDKVMEKINYFFDQLSSQLGIDSADLDQSREQTLETARAFFEKVDNVLADVKTKYVSADPPPVQIDELPATEPEQVEAPTESEQIEQPSEEMPVTA